MWPFFSNAARVVRTPLVELMPNWSMISRMVGGAPRPRMMPAMKSKIAC